MFSRYKILASKIMSELKEDKKAAKACFDKVGLAEESYRLGHTKVSNLAPFSHFIA